MTKLIGGLEKDIIGDIGALDAKLTQDKRYLLSRKLSPEKNKIYQDIKKFVVKFNGKIMVEAGSKRFRKILTILVLEREGIKASLCMDWLLDFYWTIQYSKYATNGTIQSEEGKLISQN